MRSTPESLPSATFLSRFHQLPPELLPFNAMLRCFPRSYKHYRNVPSIPLRKHRIALDVHFAQFRAKLHKQRLDRGFRFFAQMAPRSRVQRHLQGFRRPQPLLFRMLSHDAP